MHWIKYILRHSLSGLMFLALLCLIFESEAVAVTRDDLTTRVRENIRTSLLKRIAPINDQGSNDQVNEAKLAQRVEAFAADLSATIRVLPVAEISDTLAAWIEESMVAESQGEFANFAPGAKEGLARIQQLIASMEKRMRTLDEAKGKQLMEERDALLKRSLAFHQAARKYIFDKLSVVPAVRLHAVEGVLPHGVGPFLEALIMVKNYDELKYYTPFEDASTDPWDVRKQELDSQICVNAFVRDVNEKFKRYSRMDYYAQGSLFSAAFDDDRLNIVKQAKTFEALKPKIDQLYGSSVQQQGDVASINYFLFTDFIAGMLLTLRWEDVKLQVPKPNHRDKAITFSNNSQSWEMLLSANHLLTYKVEPTRGTP